MSLEAILSMFFTKLYQGEVDMHWPRELRCSKHSLNLLEEVWNQITPKKVLAPTFCWVIWFQGLDYVLNTVAHVANAYLLPPGTILWKRCPKSLLRSFWSIFEPKMAHFRLKKVLAPTFLGVIWFQTSSKRFRLCFEHRSSRGECISASPPVQLCEKHAQNRF